ncbi:MAG: hypothetical protein EBT04_15925 [Betaproteobacteria bacterium]|nr:hypothetical protein [Betaproteobacteria bacterium]
MVGGFGSIPGAIVGGLVIGWVEAFLDHGGQCIYLDRHPARRNLANRLQQVAQARAPQRPSQSEESHQWGLTRIVCVSSRSGLLFHRPSGMARASRPAQCGQRSRRVRHPPSS